MDIEIVLLYVQHLNKENSPKESYHSKAGDCTPLGTGCTLQMLELV